jgi:hypothetical protein
LFYKGTPNSSGYVIVQIPKAGTYTVDGREFIVDGIYNVYSSFNNNHDVYTSFTLTNDTTSVNINGKDLKLLTHHGFPFRRFNSTPEKNTSVFQEFDQVINSIKPNIITGDFNAENFMDLMPKTNSNYKRVFNEITTVDEMKFDDILINKESNYVSKRVIKSLSDHYMLLIEIEV